MKKILLAALCLGAIQLYAQPKWVSTTPQNKNVVIEEFTGIHCGYCPDGHRIANNIVTASPGKVCLVNIHAGSFATPGAGEPDFRTPIGNQINTNQGISSYPSASINRVNINSSNRGNWTSQAAAIMSQTSPVNVAVKASVDMTTRILTTEVELYYTSASAVPTNYLTVLLTQDNILGIQSDYGNYNPTNWVNGQYKHNHVFRQLISTGSASVGEAITTTTKDYYFYKKYTTTIPANYTSIDAVLTNLNVVAYVAETSTNILSAAETKVDFDAALKTDLKLTDVTVKPTGYCFTTINPKIDVTNNLDQTVTSFDVSAIINGVENKKTFTGSLAKNATTTVDWGSLPVSNTGTFTLSIRGFSNIKNSTATTIYDVDGTNDASSFSTFGFKSAAFTTFKNSFESGIPANMAFDLSQNSGMKILSTTTNYGARGTKSAVLWYLLASNGYAGKPASILLGEADFSANTDPGIAFYYAYSDGAQGGTAPTLAVSASEDCGATWNVVKTITCVETGKAADPNYLYVPNGWEYVYVNTSLAAYKNKKVMLKITGTPGTSGNALFVDEINIDGAGFTAMSVAENAKTNNQFELFPNPAQNNFTVKLATAEHALISVKDLTGKEILNASSNGLESVIDCENLKNGLYMVEVTSDGNTSVQKLFINK